MLGHDYNNEDARYVCYVEDEPQVWTRATDDLQQARESMKQLVDARIEANGAGSGVVVDTSDESIVETYNVAVPAGDEAKRVVRVALGWHRGTITSFES
jgi:hypothetical protein